VFKATFCTQLPLQFIIQSTAPRSIPCPKFIHISLLPFSQDIVALRKLAAIRGLVTHGLRSRVWPLLLGTHDQSHDQRDYTTKIETPHKDSQVVECDMVRSLWSWTEGWNEEDRNTKRAALKRVIDATIAGNENNLHYYQGLHDVAAVLLFVCGEHSAYRMLTKLATCHLRDCTRPSLDAVTESLTLLYPILQVADPELYNYIIGLEEPALEVPYFALSWHMTWFSHDVATLDQCARLFDLFISSHPLMPLYVAAVAVRGQRESILNCGPGAGDVVYSKLKGMNILGEGQLTADELAQQAAALYRAAPPAHLVSKLGNTLKHSTTLFAYIEDQRWQVPEEPGKRKKQRAHALVPRLNLRPMVDQINKLPLERLQAAPAAAFARLLTPRNQEQQQDGGRGSARSRQKSSHRGGGITSGSIKSARTGLQSHSLTSHSNNKNGLPPQQQQPDQHRYNLQQQQQLQGVAALTAMVFTGIAGVAFLGTTLVLTQMQMM
jgi:Rab-GTPase-TBC domain